MGKEILAIPEEHLKEVVFVIRLGLTEAVNYLERVSPTTRHILRSWCTAMDDDDT